MRFKSAILRSGGFKFNFTEVLARCFRLFLCINQQGNISSFKFFCLCDSVEDREALETRIAGGAARGVSGGEWEEEDMEVEEAMPSSLALLISAHDQLGRSELLYLMLSLWHALNNVSYNSK